MSKSDDRLDLRLDLNTMDDTGFPWAFIDSATSDPSIAHPGHYVVVGSGRAKAVAQVLDVADGIVHVRPLRGSVGSNAHLLTTPLAAS